MSRFETQALPPQPSKRRKLNTEDNPAWTEVKSISHKDYQINPKDQGFLHSDTTWVHSGNIHNYEKRPGDDDVLPIRDPVFENGHPPLDSPEPEPLSQGQDDSQFHTQAPGMMHPTQVTGVPEPTESQMSEEEIEWEPTQDDNGAVPQPRVADEPTEPIDWEESPARPARVRRLVNHLGLPS